MAIIETAQTYQEAARELEGRVALVTGGTRGIGAAISRSLASYGATVAAGYGHNHDAAVQLESELARSGARVSIHEGDVGSAEDCRRTVQEVVDLHGRLDILVNNAANVAAEFLARDADLLSLTVEHWDETLATNLRGAMLCSKHAIPAMITSGGGAIVNIGSVSGLAGDTSGMIAYSASKAGMLSLTRSIATLHGKPGIRCNVICPATIVTPAWQEQNDPETVEKVAALTLTPRVGRPEDVAAACVFLASDDEAGYVTDQTFNMDGGRMAYVLNAKTIAEGGAPRRT